MKSLVQHGHGGTSFWAAERTSSLEPTNESWVQIIINMQEFNLLSEIKIEKGLLDGGA
jgi:hypothetical protein